MDKVKRKRVYTPEERERDRIRKRERRALFGISEQERAKDREKKRKQREADKESKRAIAVLPKVRTGTREYRRAVQFKFGGSGEMTKSEMRAMFAAAVANTAAISIEGM